MAFDYPYLPPDRAILYVGEDNAFMQAAKEEARLHSLDTSMPTGAVLIQNGVIVARAANGSEFHKTHKCERVRLGIPTGQGYELCEGCHPKNHAERRVVERAQRPEGGDVYLWGHWWACTACWDVMIDSGVRNLYLLEGSERLFNKNHPENVVGKQFG
ncbi:MAG: hypothetical protein AB199_00165 [Parcubacteria bacterium C7867-004]|nr:MAG: hypothetical protein AB199_00165 [Parcubacteria bacterium C7867-004]